MIVLDTTVLVYAVGTEHHLRDPCRELVAAIGAGRISATTTVEAIQEFAHVRSRRRGREDAAKIAAAFASLLGPLLLVTEHHLRDGLELWRRHEQLGAFAAVLAAASSTAGAAVVSADMAFGDVRNLVHVRPDRAGVDHLLGSSRRS